MTLQLTVHLTYISVLAFTALLSDKRAAEFLQPLQITKTRAGMQVFNPFVATLFNLDDEFIIPQLIKLE